jgi:hypothetical protein
MSGKPGGCRFAEAVCRDCGKTYNKAIRKDAGDRCPSCYYANVIKRKKFRSRNQKHVALCGHVSPNHFKCHTCLRMAEYSGHVLGQEVAM